MNPVTKIPFQSLDLADLAAGQDLMNVPDGVWLELNLEAGALRLLRYRPHSEQELELQGEMALQVGQPHTLQPGEFFRLQQSGGQQGVQGRAEFFCIPLLYFNKKFNQSNGLGQPHSEVSYLRAYYAPLHPEYGRRPLQVLDLGCGRGRNAVIFAGDTQQDYRVLGLDHNPDSLAAWRNMAQTEGWEKDKLDSVLADLNHWRQAPSHDIAMAIVSLQFLESSAVPELLRHCAAQAAPGALHLSVFPIASEHPNIVWPMGFHFLPQSEEIRELYMQQGWAILEYRENYGHLGKATPDGLPLRGLFATLIAQKPHV